MSFEIQWGSVPAKRQKKVEKYSTPVLTFIAVDPEKKGAGRKMIFNKAAQEALDIAGEDNVSFGFAKGTKQAFVKKAVAPEGFQLTKTCTFSDKKTFEFILENFGLNEALENEFDLTVSPMGAAILEITPKASFAAIPEPVFENRDLGEITEEIDDSADLSSIPATPEGGTIYDAGIDPIGEAEAPETLNDTDFDNVEEDVAIGSDVAPDLAPEEEEESDEDTW
jgi:hypothetical protein